MWRTNHSTATAGIAGNRNILLAWILPNWKNSDQYLHSMSSRTKNFLKGKKEKRRKEKERKNIRCYSASGMGFTNCGQETNNFCSETTTSNPDFLQTLNDKVAIQIAGKAVPQGFYRVACARTEGKVLDVEISSVEKRRKEEQQ